MENLKYFTPARFWALLLLSIFLSIVVLHAWNIGNLPRGFHMDELSVGYNAVRIAQDFHDEHDHFMPVYFEAFGEYKNPINIYATAILFKLFGVHFFTLRLTSILFFSIFLAGFYFLSKRLFPDQKMNQLYALLAAGFLPWLFYFSRIATEMIVQPAIMIWFLYFFHRTYHSTEINKITPLKLSLITGLLAGISVYSYSTSRLLTFLTVLILLLVYYNSKFWKLHLNFSIAFFLALIPYGTFSWFHNSLLTNRFIKISYVYNNMLSYKEKIFKFISYYYDYFGPKFLLFRGDSNVRHNLKLGISGELSICVALLAIIGIVSLFCSKQYKKKKFELFLLLNMLTSPIAACLTESNHSPRSVLLGVYLLCFSLYGFQKILNIKVQRWRLILSTGLLGLLLIQGFILIKNYYFKYPKISEKKFGNYDLEKIISEALSQPSRQVIYADRGIGSAGLEFYRQVLHLPGISKIKIAPAIAHLNTCIIYDKHFPKIKNEKLYKISYENIKNISKLKCFGEKKSVKLQFHR